MAQSKPSPTLHPQLLEILEQLRQMVRRFVVADFVVTALVVIGAAFWGGLLLDYGPILLGGLEMPRSARSLLLLALLVALVVLAVRLLVSRLSRELPDESLALLVERQHPELGERLMTSVQLAHDTEHTDDYSRPLYNHVRREAAELSESVELSRVFQWRPLANKATVAMVMLLALVGLAIASPATAKQALARLMLLTDDPWPRQAHLEMVGVQIPVVSFADPDETTPPEIRLLEFENRTLRLARGGSATLRVRARGEASVIPELCTVHYRTASGIRGQANMRRVGGRQNGYQDFTLDGPPLDSLAEDFTFTVRGLDDRLADYRVLAIPPPAVAKLEVRCRYPEYLRDPDRNADMPDLVVDYAPGLRIREGSRLSLIGSSSVPLSKAKVMVRSADRDDEMVRAKVTTDGTQFSISLPSMFEDVTLLVLPVDSLGISPAAPLRFFFGVIQDQPPEIELDLVGIGSAITPVARIPFRGVIRDDYEVTRTEMALSLASQAGDQPILRSVDPNNDGTYAGRIDLRKLAVDDVMSRPKPGDRVNVYAEAHDEYDLSEPHITQSDLFGLDVVSSDELLRRLERRELGLRARLEQSIDEIRQLRDVLDRIARDKWLPLTKDAVAAAVVIDGLADEAARAEQLRTLRIQQASLQAAKTSEELSGIAGTLGDIIFEMENNRVDSVDHRERIREQVQQPLEAVVTGELARLREDIGGLGDLASNSQRGPAAATQAVESAEQVLLRLTAILESMIDFEGYNEILEIIRDLIDRQGRLIDDTKKEQKRSVLDLFKPR